MRQLEYLGKMRSGSPPVHAPQGEIQKLRGQEKRETRPAPLAGNAILKCIVVITYLLMLLAALCIICILVPEMCRDVESAVSQMLEGIDWRYFQAPAF